MIFEPVLVMFAVKAGELGDPETTVRMPSPNLLTTISRRSSGELSSAMVGLGVSVI